MEFIHKSEKQVFSADPISEDMIPSFMTGLSLPTDLEMIDATLVKSSRTFTFNLSYNYEDEKLKEHVRAYINTRAGLQFPAEEIQIRDPTDFPTGEEWRDDLRRSLHFEDLKIDFYESRCQITDPPQDTQIVLFLLGSLGVPMDWSKSREYLETSQAKLVKLLYHFMALEDDETVDYEYNYIYE